MLKLSSHKSPAWWRGNQIKPVHLVHSRKGVLGLCRYYRPWKVWFLLSCPLRMFGDVAPEMQLWGGETGSVKGLQGEAGVECSGIMGIPHLFHLLRKFSEASSGLNPAPVSTWCSLTSLLFWSVTPCFGSGNVWTKSTERLRLWTENFLCVSLIPLVEPVEGRAVPWGHWHVPCTAVLLGWGRLLRLNAGIWVSSGS